MKLHHLPVAVSRAAPLVALLVALLIALLISSLVAPLAARAGEGHDHGPAAPTSTGSASPRFAAVSETFELVGVLHGKQITLYLDRVADNSPVPDAQIDIEVGGAKLKAQKRGTDEFEVMLAAVPQPGVLPIIATVTVGAEVDLLAGELDIHEAAHADEAAHTHSWKEYAGWGAGGLVVLAGLVFAARRIGALRQPRARGVA